MYNPPGLSYKAQNRGFTEAEFRNVCERIAGVPLDEYFDYANTVKPLDYKKYFAYAGLDIETGDGSFRLTPVQNGTRYRKRSCGTGSADYCEVQRILPTFLGRKPPFEHVAI